MTYTTLGVVLAAGVSVIGGTLGTLEYLDVNYAARADHHRLEQRVALNEISYELREAKEEVYFYQRQHRMHPEDEEIKAQLEYARYQLRKVRERLEESKKKP